MKHLILLLVLGIAGYAIWVGIGKANRDAIWRKARPHIAPILCIVGLLVAGLLAMFYVNGINIL